MEKKSVSVIGIVGVPASYGGFETLVDNLIDTDEVTFTVYCSSKHYKVRRSTYKNACLRYINLSANGMQSILYDAVAMFDAVVRKQQVLLVLGVSGAVALPFIRLVSTAKVVTNIDGVEWRRKKWGFFSSRFLKFSEWLAVTLSDVVISDNDAIADYVLSTYGKSSRVLAYGGDHALKYPLSSKETGYACSICRIEPENNVHLILEAFASCGKPLKFVGNWSSSDYGKSLKKRYEGHKSIEILDPIYDLEKLYALRSGCDYYIHGHSAGGTNPSLVEAMHFGKPILAFDCSYNRATTEGKASYFSSSIELCNLLVNEISDFSSGYLMKNIALRRYTWDKIRQEYIDLLIS